LPQRRSHLPGQLFRTERLLDELRARLQDPMLLDDIVGVPRQCPPLYRTRVA
jgi:hypothetical protein